MESNFDENERIAFANIIDLLLCWQSSRVKKDIALLDPENKCVGQIVVEKFKTAKNDDERHTYASIASYLKDDTSAWLEIAAEVCRYARRLSDEEKQSFWSDLDWHEGIFSSSAIDEVAKVFYENVDHYKCMLKRESQMARKDYWISRLDIAQSELRDAEERAKVQRGE